MRMILTAALLATAAPLTAQPPGSLTVIHAGHHGREMACHALDPGRALSSVGRGDDGMTSIGRGLSRPARLPGAS